VLWDASASDRLATRLPGGRAAVTGLSFGESGRLLVSDGGRHVRLWELGAGSASSQRVGVSAAHAALGSGDVVAAGGDDGVVRLWRPDRVDRLGSRGEPITALAASSDGARVATEDQAGKVTAWGLERRAPLGSFEPDATVFPAGGAPSLAFGLGGRALVWSDLSGAVRFARIGDRHARTVNADADDVATAVAFSRVGPTFAWGGSGGVLLYDARTLAPVGTLPLEKERLTGLAFRPDGRVLAVATDRRARLWDVATRQALGAALARPPHPSAVAFSADGSTLAVGGSDGAVVLWRLGVLDWQRLACAIANRELTRDEWQRYVGDVPYRASCKELGVPVAGQPVQ
jgi:WD40 repeat protein